MLRRYYRKDLFENVRFRISKDDKRLLKFLSHEMGITMSEYIRSLIKADYIDFLAFRG